MNHDSMMDINFLGTWLLKGVVSNTDDDWVQSLNKQPNNKWIKDFTTPCDYLGSDSDWLSDYPLSNLIYII